MGNFSWTYIQIKKYLLQIKGQPEIEMDLNKVNFLEQILFYSGNYCTGPAHCTFLKMFGLALYGTLDALVYGESPSSPMYFLSKQQYISAVNSLSDSRRL
jgi:hypothetical protein